MLRYLDYKKMGYANHGWLYSVHHFSFANYFDPKNMNFGVLRVVNDDVIQPGVGFEPHPHQDMEIITYVLDGELTHEDSIGNKGIISRGEIQYMSAGTGIWHSEMNESDKPLHLFQLWMTPHTKGLKPNYGEKHLKWEDRLDQWMPLATGSQNAEFPIHFYSNVNLYASYLNPGRELEFKVPKGRQAYLALMEGTAIVNGISLQAKDALEIIEEDVLITTTENAHMLMFEMEKE